MIDSFKRAQLRKLLAAAPKPQLHLHLDGSLSYEFIKESIKRMEVLEKPQHDFFFGETSIPSNSEELYHWLMELKKEQILGGSVAQKNSNWKVFDFCNQFLQTAEDLCSSTYQLITFLNKEHGVNYFEIRFAPVLHTKLKLTEKDAVNAVLNGLKQAVSMLKESNINVAGGIILCALRSFPIEKAFETLELCKNMEGVVGFDIAGDEGSYPLKLFTDVLYSAKQSGIKVTVHAGEWNEKIYPMSLENISLALELNVDRIGHGLALRSAEPSLLKKIRESNTSIELCLTANCGNPKKCRSFDEHPLKLMLANELNVSGLNVDNLLLSGNLGIGSPNPTDECVRALLDCSISSEDLCNIIENGYNSAFTAENINDLKNDSIKIWREYLIPHIKDIISD